MSSIIRQPTNVSDMNDNQPELCTVTKDAE